MPGLFTIFIISLIAFLPSTQIPTPHGLFPPYGLTLNDSEKFFPILNLVQTGAYYIEEEDIEYFKGQGHSSKTYYKIYQRNDSVFLEKYWKHEDTLVLSQRDTYRRNGRRIYSLLMYPAGPICVIEYFKSKDTMVKYRNWGGPYDSLELNGVDTYDDFGNLIESDEINKNGAIYRKMKYRYDKSGRMIEERWYRPIMQPFAAQSEEWWSDTNNVKLYFKRDDSLSRLPVVLELSSRKTYQIDTSKRTIITSSYNLFENKLELSSRWKNHYDKQWRETVYDEGRKENYTETKYVDDENGHQLSMTTLCNGMVDSTGKWEYDNSGRVEKYTEKDFQTTWVYDSKGNIIESQQNMNGKLHNIQRFTISYK